jgi:hypothetical protein
VQFATRLRRLTMEATRSLRAAGGLRCRPRGPRNIGRDWLQRNRRSSCGGGADRARALAHLGALTSWEERLVLAAWHWTRDVTQYRSLSQMDAPLGSKGRKPDNFRNRSCEPVWDLGLFSAAFPEFWATEAEVNLNGAPWDSVALGQWFAARAVAQKVPMSIDKYPVSHGIFGPKYKPVWRFESAEWGPVSVVKSFGPTVFMNFGPGRKRLQIASGASEVAESCGLGPGGGGRG